ncbi:YfiR family protein [Permianibacter aggregans]|uniref:Uncharacterized protein DUF4154 n=1 Tax=Permianibacter aggregans TaxID=1510150 RepID=A0A4R6UXD7_9GAMM|nr:YfiR family protein [Permianibacter aggregans]QGX38861.1 YfiR family protein [Permianibacter aggregans]TDQ50669.1 uncharacterized protein DUF4154 [Permianibacter aggregans]
MPSRWLNNRHALSLTTLLLSSLALDDTHAADMPITVETRRVVWLERFTQYVHWPKDHRVQNLEQPFTLCVAGDPAFFTLVDALIAPRRIRQKTVRPLPLSGGETSDDCDAAFIGSASVSDFDRWLLLSRQENILLVSATAGLAERGAHINMYEEQGLQKFEINNVSAQQSGLLIDARLLSAGRPVRSKEARP